MISGQFPPRVSSGVRPCRVHTASMIDTLSENCFSSGFKFMSHSGVIMPHVKVDQAISLHTTPSFVSPSTGEGEYLPFFFPFLIISLPNGGRRSSIRRFPFFGPAGCTEGAATPASSPGVPSRRMNRTVKERRSCVRRFSYEWRDRLRSLTVFA